MSSEVYFSSLNNEKNISPLNKITTLLEKCGINENFQKE